MFTDASLLGNGAISPALEEDLTHLDETCARAAREMATSRSVRETLELAAVSVPHHLQTIARGRVYYLGRLPRLRDLRVEQVVQDQLNGLLLERDEHAASRQLDRLRAGDWTFLRTDYGDLYNKAMRQAQRIIDRKRGDGR